MLNNVVICSNQQQSTGHENVRVAGIIEKLLLRENCIIALQLHITVGVDQFDFCVIFTCARALNNLRS